MEEARVVIEQLHQAVQDRDGQLLNASNMMSSANAEGQSLQQRLVEATSKAEEAMGNLEKQRRSARGVIDTKTIGRPQTWDGEESGWSD